MLTSAPQRAGVVYTNNATTPVSVLGGGGTVFAHLEFPPSAAVDLSCKLVLFCTISFPSKNARALQREKKSYQIHIYISIT